MALFVISDLHLSFGTDKPMDVFGARWENFETRLEANWKKRVSPDDTVVLPGDLSWGMDLAEALPDFRFINELPGQKILLKGNHDYYWNTAKKLSEFLTENGFSTIRFLHNNALYAEGRILCGSRGWNPEDQLSEEGKKITAREMQRFETSLAAGKKLRTEYPNAPLIAFSHYPPATLFAESPIIDLLVSYQVKDLYYGHLHRVTDPSKLVAEARGVRFTLVSADYLNFDPIEI